MEQQNIKQCLELLKQGRKNSSGRQKNPLDLATLVKNLKDSLFLKSVQERIKSKVLSPRNKQGSKHRQAKEGFQKTLGSERLSQSLRQGRSSRGVEKNERAYQRFATLASESIPNEDPSSQYPINQTLNSVILQQPSLHPLRLTGFKKKGLNISDSENVLNRTKYKTSNSSGCNSITQKTHYSRYLDGTFFKPQPEGNLNRAQLTRTIQLLPPCSKMQTHTIQKGLSPLKQSLKRRTEEERSRVARVILSQNRKPSSRGRKIDRYELRGQVDLKSEQRSNTGKGYSIDHPVARSGLGKSNKLWRVDESRLKEEKGEQISGWEQSGDDLEQ